MMSLARRTKPMDKFSDFILEKNLSTDKNVQGKKTIDPRKKTSISNYSRFLGSTGHKKKFKPRERVSRSNYDKAVGRRKRRGSKTKSARQILSNKFGIKKAMAKDGNNRYVLKHLDIQEMIKRLGYVYDNVRMFWTNNEKAKPIEEPKNKKTKTKPEKPKGSNIDTEEPSSTPTVDTEKEEENSDEDGEQEIVTLSDGSKLDMNDTKFSFIGNGGIEYDITEDDLRSYSARLALARFFEMPSALKFEEAEEEEEGKDEKGKRMFSVYVDPVIPREKVLDKINNLGYSWNVNKQEWEKNGKSVFEIFKDSDNYEDKEIMLGRVYLAIMGYLHSLEFTEGEPTMSAEEVKDNMETLGFSYNQDSGWEHFNG